MNKGQLRQLIREVIQKKLQEAKATPAEQAKKMGLSYAGWGRWMDDSGKIVARTLKGKLTKVEPEEPEEHGVDPKTSKALDKIFKKAGHWNYNPIGATHISPGWNTNKELAGDDSPFDAHAEETVKKLLAKVGDPVTLIRWLVKKFQQETPNGKKRILQYIGVLKDMGLDVDPNAQSAEKASAPREKATPTTVDMSGSLRSRDRSKGDLFAK